MFDWQTLAGAAVTILVIAMVFSRLIGSIEKRRHDRTARARLAATPAPGNPKRASTMSGRGELRQADEIKTVSVEVGSKGSFFEQRELETKKREQLEQQSRGWQADLRDSDVDQALSDWLDTEEEKEAKLNELKARAVKAARASESVAADGESADGSSAPSPWAGPEGKKRFKALHDEISDKSAAIEQQANDLEFIVNKLETSVDFISMEYQETVDKWKQGQVHRKSTLEDLRQRYRMKTFSLDDAWDMVFSYPEIVAADRKRLAKFVERLGTQRRRGESISQLVVRAEQEQWEKSLDIDMDTIFLLKEIGKTHGTLGKMEHRLAALEAACGKRSNQVIAPDRQSAKPQQ